MAPKLRIQHAGAIDHVMSRGDRHQIILKDDDDCQRSLETLGEARVKTDMRAHAFHNTVSNSKHYSPIKHLPP